MKNVIRISSFIEEEDLLNLMLGQIEEAESTHLILEITKWLLSEVDAYGEDCEDTNIKEVIRLLKMSKD